MLLQLSHSPHLTPLHPALPPPSHIPPLQFMPMGHTYKFFGFYISYTILTLPLSIFHLSSMLLILGGRTLISTQEGVLGVEVWAQATLGSLGRHDCFTLGCPLHRRRLTSPPSQDWSEGRCSQAGPAPGSGGPCTWCKALLLLSWKLEQFGAKGTPFSFCPKIVWPVPLSENVQAAFQHSRHLGYDRHCTFIPHILYFIPQLLNY